MTDTFNKKQALALLGQGKKVFTSSTVYSVSEHGDICNEYGETDWNDVSCGESFQLYVEPLTDEEIAAHFEMESKEASLTGARVAYARAAKVVRERKL